jgi:hypothetical protein
LKFPQTQNSYIPFSVSSKSANIKINLVILSVSDSRESQDIMIRGGRLSSVPGIWHVIVGRVWSFDLDHVYLRPISPKKSQLHLGVGVKRSVNSEMGISSSKTMARFTAVTPNGPTPTWSRFKAFHPF